MTRQIDPCSVFVAGASLAEPDPVVRVLVVDDEPAVCWSMLRAAHLSDGVQFVTVMTQRVARVLLEDERSHFDAAVIDPGLRDGSGYELAVELRAHLPRAAIVFLSGSEHDAKRAAEQEHVCGAEAFLQKPVGFGQLVFQIERAIEKRRLGLEVLHKPPLTLRLLNADKSLGESSELDEADVEASFDGKRVRLRTSDLRLVAWLIRTPDEHVTHGTLRRALGLCTDPKEQTNAVYKAVSRLRERLSEQIPGSDRCFQQDTGRGFVYRPLAYRG